jgi:mono/diheme cytochrome c family protein
MAEIQMLGLFHEATPTAEVIEELHKLGVPDDRITVLSSVPYRAEILGRPRPKGRVGGIALVGALLGLLTGLFLTVGIWLLYPLRQGGQPLVPIPPTLIVLFEVTMLGTMWSAFFGVLHTNVFPIFKSEIYDPRITEGHIGVVVQVDESLADQVENTLKANGAHHMHREVYLKETDKRRIIFRASVPAAILILVSLILLVAYDVIRIPFPTQMEHQDSVGYDQGPRLAAPANAVPIQGPVLIAGQPASGPVPASADSLQRGEVLFGLICRVCHGQTGNGSSPISGMFNPSPADLTSDKVQNLTDSEIYLVVTQGFNLMPSMAENLSPEERWDVINYVRSLKK